MECIAQLQRPVLAEFRVLASDSGKWAMLDDRHYGTHLGMGLYSARSQAPLAGSFDSSIMYTDPYNVLSIFDVGIAKTQYMCRAWWSR